MIKKTVWFMLLFMWFIVMSDSNAGYRLSSEWIKSKSTRFGEAIDNSDYDKTAMHGCTEADDKKIAPIVEVGNCEFDEYIKNAIRIENDEEIDDIECIETDLCYRVGIKKEQMDGIFAHVGDYFFVKNDKLTHFVTYYNEIDESIGVMRLVHHSCNYNAAYEDVSFDGIKDVIISLGYEGDIEISCAYVYMDGEYVYVPSFEMIGSYSVDSIKKTILDYNNNRYVFEDGEYKPVVNEIIEDQKFKKYVDKMVIIDKGELIDKSWWIAEDMVYRVSINLTEEDRWGISHSRDYFFIKDTPFKCIEVNYPSKGDNPLSDRYPWDACGFEAEFRDVTFDGNKDIIICLGYGGTSAARIHCAYVFENGDYVYKKSFEKISDYSVNNAEKCIEGWYRSGTCYYRQRAIYENGEFVIEDFLEDD